MPTEIRQEFVIGGWTESESNRPFRSLLFGYYENGKLINAGHAGGGFKETEMPQILAKLKKLETAKNPFSNKVETETKAHWIKPELIAEIKYATRTRGGKIRKPAIFLGFREDKQPSEVRKEISLAQQDAKQKKIKGSSGKEDAAGSNWPAIEKQTISSEGSFDIEGQQLRLTNIEKEIWKGITKAQLIQYYHTVAPLMLPHCLGRPMSLHIKHRGPTAPGLYIKDMEGRQPAWAALFSMIRKHKKKDRRDRIDYLVCNGEASLLFMVNLGCIDINPWTSKAVHPEQPDFIIIDLDPSDDDFSKVIESALAAQEYFAQRKITGFPKTSGKTGMHLYLPCSGFGFGEARTIAENICSGIHALVPGITTTAVSISQRGSLLYLDPNQNDFADTVAAPYSVRPYPTPSVSTPLEWTEIRAGLDALAFNLHTVPSRIQKKGDLFRKLLDPVIASKNNKSLLRLLS
jgi:bifunctional non-homologous end joining protein LigD